jgi:hypothetical protein
MAPINVVFEPSVAPSWLLVTVMDMSTRGSTASITARAMPRFPDRRSRPRRDLDLPATKLAA